MKSLFILACMMGCLMLSACGSNQQTTNNKEAELLRKEKDLSKKEAELAKKELEISQGNTANKNTNDAQQPPGVALFDFSMVKGRTLNQIFTSQGLIEIRKLISADSKKRLVRVKDKVLKDMKSGQGGWNGGTELWFDKGFAGEGSFEDGWQAGMKREYSSIEIEKHFTMTKSGITFRYDTPIGFPMSVRELEPSSTYFYSWAVLKPYLIPSSPVSN